MNLEEMDFAALLDLADEFRPYLFALILSLVRAYAFMSASQILAPTAVPRLARQAAILVIVIPIVPANLAAARDFDPSIPEFAVFFLKEYALGFLLGYMVAWLFWAVQAAGAFIDNQRGAAIAASIDPLQGHETSPLGILFSQAFVTYFFTVGGFLLVLDLIYQSYVSWPVTRGIPALTDVFPALVLEVFDTGMRLMFVLAAPIIAIMFLAEFALAIVSRFAPQVQVFIIAMPIKSAIAFLILIFYFATMFAVARDNADLFRPLMDRTYAILRAGAELLDEFGFDLAPGGR